MSAVIKTRVLSSVTDNRFRIQNSTVQRRFTLPSWNEIRIGVRFTMDGTVTTAGVNNNFAFGFVSNNGQTGVVWVPDYNGFNWNAAAGGNAAYYSQKNSLNYFIVTQSGTGVLGPGQTISGICAPADVTVATRRFLMLSVIKGSPNYTFTLTYPSGPISASLDFSSQNLFDLLLISAYGSAPTGHLQYQTSSYAFSEAGGALDTVSLGWSCSTSPVFWEVCDVAVARIS